MDEWEEMPGLVAPLALLFLALFGPAGIALWRRLFPEAGQKILSYRPTIRKKKTRSARLRAWVPSRLK